MLKRATALLAGLSLMCVGGAALAERVTLTGPVSRVFDIDVRGTAVPPASGDSGSGAIYNGTDDATDQWPHLCVCASCTLPAQCAAGDVYHAGDVAYTTDLGGRRVILGTMTIAGLEVHREAFVPATGTIDFVRYWDVLENPTGSDITVNVRLGSAFSAGNVSDLGSDSGTTITATSDGDTVAEGTDTFICTDDGTDGGGDPSLGHVMQGIDRVVSVSAVGINSMATGDSSEVSWELVGVTVPAGERVVIVSFFIQAADRATAEAAAAALDDVTTWPAEALEGVDPLDLGLVVNFMGDADGDGYTIADGDCDDRSDEVYPGATELCDGLDNDCDGTTDEELLPRDTYFADRDRDGYGDDLDATDACTAPPDHTLIGGDCDDADAHTYPGAIELCDGLDNDCDVFIDEDVVYADFYEDRDGDLFGDDATLVNTCEAMPGWVRVGGDCNDACATCYPGGVEVCDELDNDCDGDVDEELSVMVWSDADGDGWGNPPSGRVRCGVPEGYVERGEDCNDVNAAVHPEADEICDGLDNDCDGESDEGLMTTYYADADGDGHGDPASTEEACDGAPEGYVASSDDCDDTNDEVSPEAEEVPADGVDNDCDGEVDEGEGGDGDGDVDGDVDADVDADADGDIDADADADAHEDGDVDEDGGGGGGAEGCDCRAAPGGSDRGLLRALGALLGLVAP